MDSRASSASARASCSGVKCIIMRIISCPLKSAKIAPATPFGQQSTSSAATSFCFSIGSSLSNCAAAERAPMDIAAIVSSSFCASKIAPGFGVAFSFFLLFFPFFPLAGSGSGAAAAAASAAAAACLMCPPAGSDRSVYSVPPRSSAACALTAVASFSGCNLPNAGPMRRARITAASFSASRSFAGRCLSSLYCLYNPFHRIHLRDDRGGFVRVHPSQQLRALFRGHAVDGSRELLGGDAVENLRRRVRVRAALLLRARHRGQQRPEVGVVHLVHRPRDRGALLAQRVAGHVGQERAHVRRIHARENRLRPLLRHALHRRRGVIPRQRVQNLRHRGRVHPVQHLRRALRAVPFQGLRRARRRHRRERLRRRLRLQPHEKRAHLARRHVLQLPQLRERVHDVDRERAPDDRLLVQRHAHGVQTSLRPSIRPVVPPFSERHVHGADPAGWRQHSHANRLGPGHPPIQALVRARLDDDVAGRHHARRVEGGGGRSAGSAGPGRTRVHAEPAEDDVVRETRTERRNHLRDVPGALDAVDGDGEPPHAGFVERERRTVCAVAVVDDDRGDGADAVGGQERHVDEVAASGEEVAVAVGGVNGERRRRVGVDAVERVAEEDAPQRVRGAGGDLQHPGVPREVIFADPRVEEVRPRARERRLKRRRGERRFGVVFENHVVGVGLRPPLVPAARARGRLRLGREHRRVPVPIARRDDELDDVPRGRGEDVAVRGGERRAVHRRHARIRGGARRVRDEFERRPDDRRLLFSRGDVEEIPPARRRGRDDRRVAFRAVDDVRVDVPRALRGASNRELRLPARRLVAVRVASFNLKRPSLANLDLEDGVAEENALRRDGSSGDADALKLQHGALLHDAVVRAADDSRPHLHVRAAGHEPVTPRVVRVDHERYPLPRDAAVRPRAGDLTRAEPHLLRVHRDHDRAPVDRDAVQGDRHRVRANLRPGDARARGLRPGFDAQRDGHRHRGRGDDSDGERLAAGEHAASALLDHLDDELVVAAADALLPSSFLLRHRRSQVTRRQRAVRHDELVRVVREPPVEHHAERPRALRRTRKLQPVRPVAVVADADVPADLAVRRAQHAANVVPAAASRVAVVIRGADVDLARAADEQAHALGRVSHVREVPREWTARGLRAQVEQRVPGDFIRSERDALVRSRREREVVERAAEAARRAARARRRPRPGRGRGFAGFGIAIPPLSAPLRLHLHDLRQLSAAGVLFLILLFL
eukprot:31510-Pelagococcus_subviridis.AAC.15